MPIYQYRCLECENIFDKFLLLRDYKQPQRCPECSAEAARHFTPVAVFGDWAGYECPVTGKWIEGRRAHEENLKRTDSRLLEPGETEAKAKARKAADEALDKSLDATVDAEIAAMPARKRERLFEEVAAGATLTVERK